MTMLTPSEYEADISSAVMTKVGPHYLGCAGFLRSQAAASVDSVSATQWTALVKFSLF